MKLDDELCLCFHVTKRKVINYIRVQRPGRPAQLADCWGAGTGCGWCRTYLAKLLKSVQEGQVEVADEPEAKGFAAGRSGYVRSGGGTPPPGATPIDED